MSWLDGQPGNISQRKSQTSNPLPEEALKHLAGVSQHTPAITHAFFPHFLQELAVNTFAYSHVFYAFTPFINSQQTGLHGLF